MTKIFRQEAAELLDMSDPVTGASFFETAQPGDVPVVNDTRDGFVPGAGGGGAGTVTSVNGEFPDEFGNVTVPMEPGPPGMAGPPNVLTVGTVSSGDEPAVTFTGTSPAQVANFVLPRGEKGEMGEQGAPGEPGQPGTNGTNGSDGGPGPQGVQGPPGMKPDAYGNLTEAVITDIETAGVPWIYVVNTDGDLRSNQSIPAGIAGDQSRNIIGWTPDNGWQSYAPFTGIPGPQGPEGPTGSPGAPGEPGAPGAPGVVDYSLVVRRDGTQASTAIQNGLNWYGSANTIPASAINFALGDTSFKTLSANTTFTVAGAPSSGTTLWHMLELTTPGGFTAVWPASFKWENDTAPDLTEPGVYLIGIYSRNGGGTYRCTSKKYVD